MTPYADFLYFGVLLYVVVPTLVLGWLGWLNRRWVALVMLAMLVVQYGGMLHISPQLAVRDLWVLAAYLGVEWVIAAAFLRVRSRTSTRWPFRVALALALLPLVIAKFLPLFTADFQLGFLGISYVTFRCLDVIFCIQDKLITTLPVGQFVAYIAFFATISSGPIDRYRRFAGDWTRARDRDTFLQDLDAVVHRVFTGFFYKFILAALVKQHWMDVVAARSGVAAMVSYMYAYSFYLFFDFAGYSAFAIGVSYLFGIHTPENFDRPFLARNIRDFWNRWHISLSAWFRDHVYTRFVMAAMKGRWFKSRYVSSHLGYLLAFGLMGLWHGTAANYIAYGLYHAALLIGHDVFTRWNKRRKLWGDGQWWNLASVFVTFNCVCFGFLIFSGHLGFEPRGLRSSTGSTEVTEGSRFEGSLAAADCSAINGWAWDSARPNASIAVDIYSDDTLVTTVMADKFREDLQKAGKGNGHHGFAYTPAHRFMDGRAHAITVKISGTDVAVSGAPTWVACMEPVLALDGFEGTHGHTDCEVTRGWAWDVSQPDTPIDVDIYDGDTLLTTVTANVFRKDLLDGGYGNGSHGFQYAPPARLKDGAVHVIVAKIRNTNLTLMNSPKVLICPPHLSPDPSPTRRGE